MPTLEARRTNQRSSCVHLSTQEAASSDKLLQDASQPVLSTKSRIRQYIGCSDLVGPWTSVSRLLGLETVAASRIRCTCEERRLWRHFFPTTSRNRRESAESHKVSSIEVEWWTFAARWGWEKWQVFPQKRCGFIDSFG